MDKKKVFLRSSIYINSTYEIISITDFFILCFQLHLDSGYSVNTNDAVRVSSVKGGSISTPSEGSTVRSSGLLAHLVKVLRSQSVNNNLAFQIPDLDLLISGSTQPVTVR